MVVKKRLNKFKLVNFCKAIDYSDKEVFIKNGIVIPYTSVTNKDDFEVIDSKDCIVTPGFIDPQVNGLDECNFWTIADLPYNIGFAQIDELRLKLAYCGVVAFCPTIITAQKEKILKSIDYINSYIKQADPTYGARILGIHLEGIFITKFGVHESKYVQKGLTVENISSFVKDNVILFTLAPELDKTGEAIKFLQKNNILVSIGHSNAGYLEGDAVIKKYNLKTVTHMFNALKGVEGFSHRDSNALGFTVLKSKLNKGNSTDLVNDGIMLAALENENVLCMVIADGVHVDKEVIRFLKNHKDSEHFALASDIVSLDCFNLAKTKGILGGGQNTLDKCILNLINWNVSKPEDSLMSASKPIVNQLKPVQAIGLGEIAFHKEANIALWDTNKNAVKGTIIGQNVFLNY